MTKIHPPSTDLVDAVYDLALDPKRFEEFTQAWDHFSTNSIKHATELSQAHSRLNAAMARHFERAFMLMEKIGRSGQREGSLQYQVNESSNPSVAIDQHGNVLASNSAAIELFGSSSNLLCESAIHSDSFEPLKKCIERLMLIDTALPVLVLLHNRAPSLFLMKKIAGSSNIIIDVAGSSWSEQANELLRSNYKLSSIECEIVAQLYQGLSVKRVAASRHRSEDTIRTQISSILKKTNCGSQVQLMRLTTSILFLSVNEVGDDWFSDAHTLQRIVLEDGRRMDYYDIGKKGDPVVMVLHGIMHTPELPAEVRQPLLDSGYRIIGLCRAGYGHSSPPSDWHNLLDGFVADLLEIQNQLGISTAHLIGSMAGSVYAFAMAAQHPSRVLSVMCVAGVVPYITEQQLEGMPIVVKTLVNSGRYFPKLFPLLVRSAVALVDRGETGRITNIVYRHSTPDYHASEQAEIKQNLDRCYRFTVHQGYSAYAFSGLQTVQNHHDLAAKVRCPINLIHGVDDGIQLIGFVRDFANDNDKVTLVEIAHAGQLVMYAKPKKVSQHLLNFLKSVSS